MLLPREQNEVQSELDGGRRYTDAGVGLARGHRSGNREMGGFGMVISTDSAWRNTFPLQHLVNFKARSRAALAIDETNVNAFQIRNAGDAFRVARRDHQALALGSLLKV